MKYSHVIDSLAKMAGYLKSIKCEQCNYSGSPLSDGRCPDCGSFAGVMPKRMSHSSEPEYSRDLNTKEYFDQIENAVHDTNSYI